jgi:hypothetical protein
MTLDAMYQSLHDVFVDDEDAKRVREAARELGEEYSAVLDQLIDRGLAGEAVTYLQISNQRHQIECAVMANCLGAGISRRASGPLMPALSSHASE